MQLMMCVYAMFRTKIKQRLLSLSLIVGLVAFQSIVALPSRQAMSHMAKNWASKQKALYSSPWRLFVGATVGAILLSDDELEKIKKYNPGRSRDYEELMALVDPAKMQDLRLRQLLMDKTLDSSRSAEYWKTHHPLLTPIFMSETRVEDHKKKSIELALKLLDHIDGAQEPEQILEWLVLLEKNGLTQLNNGKLAQIIKEKRIISEAVKAIGLQNRSGFSYYRYSRALAYLSSVEDLAYMFLYVPGLYWDTDYERDKYKGKKEEILFDGCKPKPMLVQFIDEAIHYRRFDFIANFFTEYSGVDFSNAMVTKIYNFYFEHVIENNDLLVPIFSKFLGARNHELVDQFIKVGENFFMQALHEKTDSCLVKTIDALYKHDKRDRSGLHRILKNISAKDLIDAGKLDLLYWFVKKQYKSHDCFDEAVPLMIRSMHEKGAPAFFTELAESSKSWQDSFLQAILRSSSRTDFLNFFIDHAMEIHENAMSKFLVRWEPVGFLFFHLPEKTDLYDSLINYIIESNNINAFEAIFKRIKVDISRWFEGEDLFPNVKIEVWAKFWIEHRDRLFAHVDNDHGINGRQGIYRDDILSQLIEFLANTGDINSLSWLAQHNIDIGNFPHKKLSSEALGSFAKHWQELPSIFQERLNAYQPWKEYQLNKDNQNCCQ